MRRVAFRKWLLRAGFRARGLGATSMVQAESPALRPTTDGDALEKMKKYVHELELKNAELEQKLEAGEAKLKEVKEYTNSDPVIEAELKKCHVFLCSYESNYKKVAIFLADPNSKLTMIVKVPRRKIKQALKQLEKDQRIYIPPGARTARDEPKEFSRMTTLAKYIILGII